MKKNYAVIAALVLVSSAHAAEIATVLGAPEASLGFVQSILEESIDFTGGATPEKELTTRVYSVLARKGVRSATALNVLGEEGSTSMVQLRRGLDVGSLRAPVVLTSIGPINGNERTCDFLSDPYRAETVFVVVAGSSSMELDPRSDPACLAGNILFVTALNPVTEDLMTYANWGELVRLASPATGILATGPDGQVSLTGGMTLASSLVGARLAIFARNHPEWRGAFLVEHFLEGETRVLPKLQGKVAGARALNDSGR